MKFRQALYYGSGLDFQAFFGSDAIHEIESDAVLHCIDPLNGYYTFYPRGVNDVVVVDTPRLKFHQMKDTEFKRDRSPALVYIKGYFPDTSVYCPGDKVWIGSGQDCVCVRYDDDDDYTLPETVNVINCSSCGVK